MNRNEQAARLALQAFLATVVYLRCNSCGHEQSSRQSSVCFAAYNAVSAGWRVDEGAQVYCPACARAKGLKGLE